MQLRHLRVYCGPHKLSTQRQQEDINLHFRRRLVSGQFIGRDVAESGMNQHKVDRFHEQWAICSKIILNGLMPTAGKLLISGDNGCPLRGQWPTYCVHYSPHLHNYLFGHVTPRAAQQDGVPAAAIVVVIKDYQRILMTVPISEISFFPIVSDH